METEGGKRQIKWFWNNINIKLMILNKQNFHLFITKLVFIFQKYISPLKLNVKILI